MELKICSICGEAKSLYDDFYSNGLYKGKPKYKPSCKLCEMKHKKELAYINLVKAYGKPLKCEVCGYDKNLAALDFHHIDPNQKEFGLSSKNISMEKLIPEIKKCICLCSNCHRELHYPQWTDRL